MVRSASVGPSRGADVEISSCATGSAEAIRAKPTLAVIVVNAANVTLSLRNGRANVGFRMSDGAESMKPATAASMPCGTYAKDDPRTGRVEEILLDEEETFLAPSASFARAGTEPSARWLLC